MKTNLPLLWLALAAVLPLAAFAQPAGPGGRPDRYGGNPPRIGEKVSDAVVYSPDGKPGQLAALWQDRPTVFVTASITCGPSCKAMPDLLPLREKFGDKLHVVVLYVQEAHPDGEVSPYYPTQPARPALAQGGHRQPRSLAERLEFARQFAATYAPSATIVVDAMDNAAWQAVGKGPNLGLLVGTDGTLVFKQGWFSLSKLTAAVEQHLTTKP